MEGQDKPKFLLVPESEYRLLVTFMLTKQKTARKRGHNRRLTNAETVEVAHAVEDRINLIRMAGVAFVQGAEAGQAAAAKKAEQGGSPSEASQEVTASPAVDEEGPDVRLSTDCIDFAKIGYEEEEPAKGL